MLLLLLLLCFSVFFFIVVAVAFAALDDVFVGGRIVVVDNFADVVVVDADVDVVARDAARLIKFRLDVPHPTQRSCLCCLRL
jgi:hypothetical protein